MYEIERKFRLNPNEAAGLKVKLDAKYGAGKKLVQKDALFLYKKTSYSEHVTGEPALRIRSSDGKHYFTYKHTILASGNRVEHETEIGNPGAMKAALIAMDWHEVITVEKTRYHYEAAGVTYELDTVTGLGDFLEVEIISDEDSDAETALISIAASLGVPADRIERRSYGKLLQEKTNA